MTRVKICGLCTPETVEAAIEAGADYLGFMLFPRSPRALSVEQAAPLLAQAAGRSRTVAVLVDPDPALLDAVAALGPDLIQLHGRETPDAVAAARRRTGRPVIKALPVAERRDLEAAAAYDADHLMFDAKPPPGADRLGGHGAAFDWSLLEGSAGGPPAGANGAPASGARDGPAGRGGRGRTGAFGELWFLAGGLTPDNVGEALRVTGAPAVDVSSGVERSPGVKDPALIAAFIRAVRDPDAQGSA